MITISPGQAMLILIGHLKEKPHYQEDVEFLKKAYLAGISAGNEEDITRLNALISNHPALFSKYEISNDFKVINEDSSRRYFETHLAYHSMKDQKEMQLSDLKEHCLQLKRIIPNHAEQEHYSDMLYGRKPIVDDLGIKESATAIQRIDTLEAYKDFTPEAKEKIKLLIEVAFWGVKAAQIHGNYLPLNLYSTGIYSEGSRGKVLKSPDYKNVHSSHLGIIKSYMSVPLGDIASSEEKMKIHRSPDQATISDEKASWIEFNASSLVNPFVNSISGTMLCQLRALKYLHDSDSLTLTDLTGLIKGMISSSLYMKGGHSLFEFFQVLQLPEIQSAFSFIPNFAELTSVNLYYEKNKTNFNIALDNAIDYNKQLLSRAELHAEIKSGVIGKNKEKKDVKLEEKEPLSPKSRKIFSKINAHETKSTVLPPGVNIYFVNIDIDKAKKELNLNFKKADGTIAKQSIPFEKLDEYLLSLAARDSNEKAEILLKRINQALNESGLTDRAVKMINTTNILLRYAKNPEVNRARIGTLLWNHSDDKDLANKVIQLAASIIPSNKVVAFYHVAESAYKSMNLTSALVEYAKDPSAHKKNIEALIHDSMDTPELLNDALDNARNIINPHMLDRFDNIAVPAHKTAKLTFTFLEYAKNPEANKTNIETLIRDSMGEPKLLSDALINLSNTLHPLLLARFDKISTPAYITAINKISELTSSFVEYAKNPKANQTHIENLIRDSMDEPKLLDHALTNARTIMDPSMRTRFDNIAWPAYKIADLTSTLLEYAKNPEANQIHIENLIRNLTDEFDLLEEALANVKSEIDPHMFIRFNNIAWPAYRVADLTSAFLEYAKNPETNQTHIENLIHDSMDEPDLLNEALNNAKDAINPSMLARFDNIVRPAYRIAKLTSTLLEYAKNPEVNKTRIETLIRNSRNDLDSINEVIRNVKKVIDPDPVMLARFDNIARPAYKIAKLTSDLLEYAKNPEVNKTRIETLMRDSMKDRHLLNEAVNYVKDTIDPGMRTRFDNIARPAYRIADLTFILLEYAQNPEANKTQIETLLRDSMDEPDLLNDAVNNVRVSLSTSALTKFDRIAQHTYTHFVAQKEEMHRKSSSSLSVIYQGLKIQSPAPTLAVKIEGVKKELDEKTVAPTEKAPTAEQRPAERPRVKPIPSTTSRTEDQFDDLARSVKFAAVRYLSTYDTTFKKISNRNSDPHTIKLAKKLKLEMHRFQQDEIKNLDVLKATIANYMNQTGETKLKIYVREAAKNHLSLPIGHVATPASDRATKNQESTISDSATSAKPADEDTPTISKRRP